MTRIGESAFIGCCSLTNITIGKGAASIGAYAFFGCNFLTSITIGSGVTRIGDSAFEDGGSGWYRIRRDDSGVETITKGSYWNDNTGNYTVTCANGTLRKSES